MSASQQCLAPENDVALKEWAVVIAAMAAGSQTILLRKGGLYERRGDFEVERQEFWLFPTRFHQAPTELAAHGQEFVDAGRLYARSSEIVLPVYAQVVEQLELASPATLPFLRPFHILAEQTAVARFHYRSPGVTALLLRAFQPIDPVVLPDSPQFGGCRSWIQLPRAISTADLQPVLDDVRFEAVRRQFQTALNNPAQA